MRDDTAKQAIPATELLPIHPLPERSFASEANIEDFTHRLASDCFELVQRYTHGTRDPSLPPGAAGKVDPVHAPAFLDFLETLSIMQALARITAGVLTIMPHEHWQELMTEHLEAIRYTADAIVDSRPKENAT